MTIDEAARLIDGGGTLSDSERSELVWAHSTARRLLEVALCEIDRQRNPTLYESEGQRRERMAREDEATRINREIAARIREDAEHRKMNGPPRPYKPGPGDAIWNSLSAEERAAREYDRTPSGERAKDTEL